MKIKTAPISSAALAAFLSGDIANALVASTPGGIEQQEATGQRDFALSTKLPKLLNGISRGELESLGFSFGDDVDNLFVTATLPSGWTKLPSKDSSYHTDILDEKVRRRGYVFYKAAFYDKRAELFMARRFRINGYAEGSSDRHLRCVVVDEADGSVIFDAGERMSGEYDKSEAMLNAAYAWLTENWPEWQSPLAYWE